MTSRKRLVALLLLPLTFMSSLAAVNDDVRAFVDEFIAGHPVAVFSKSYCPYSKRAKEALQSFEFHPGTFRLIELDQRYDGEEMLDYLFEKTGER